MAKKQNSLQRAIWKDRFDSIKSFIKTAAGGLIIIFVAFGLLIASNIVIGGWNHRLSVRYAEVNNRSADLNGLLVRSQQAKERQASMSKGVDMERARSDMAATEEYFNRLFSWEDRADFDAVLEELSASNVVKGNIKSDLFGNNVASCEYLGHIGFVKTVGSEYTYYSIVRLSYIETVQVEGADEPMAVANNRNALISYRVTADGDIVLSSLIWL